MMTIEGARQLVGMNLVGSNNDEKDDHIFACLARRLDQEVTKAIEQGHKDFMPVEQESLSGPSVGKTYDLRHSSFGRAVVTVTGIPDETWIDVKVVAGTMRGIGRGAVWGPGDSKRVRREHCTFTPNEEQQIVGSES